MKKIYLILNNLRSMENVGSIFRTADAAGVKKIYLCGTTPKPPRKEIDKAALGAVDFVQWEYRGSAIDLIHELKKKNIPIFALEQTENCVVYNTVKYPNELALIVGNEVDGVDSSLINLTDMVIEIPMLGQKNSLNVAVATGIAVFEIRNYKFLISK
ncbi:MAG TPA: RNA methyltransferase [bacterium]|nr:RNA methyltransferase [bacterium]